MKRTVFGMMLILLLIGLSSFVLNVQQVKAIETIYIRVDGSIYPSTLLIQRIGRDLYTLSGDIDSSADGIVILRDNMTLDGAGYALQGSGSGGGIILSGRSNVTIMNMRIAEFDQGISLDSLSRKNSIRDNTITNNTYNGIVLSGSNNSVSGNDIESNHYAAIVLALASYNNVSGNIIKSNYYGVVLNMSTPQNNIVGNAIAMQSSIGIMFDSSSGNSISGNGITANSPGIYFRYSSYNIIIGNNISANGNMGIFLDYSSNYNSIAENGITGHSTTGISLYSNSYNHIFGNSITNNWYGIEPYSSSNNTIRGNKITNNDYGIYHSWSSNNTIVRNNIAANNYYGLFVWQSSSNSISENNITNNSYGFWIEHSSNNSLYHNNIIDNPGLFAYLYNSTNAWDDDYPSGGNYWRRGNSTDLFRGSYQNITGSDGIDDKPFIINGNNRDRYPLMGPFGSSTLQGQNVTVFPTDDVGLTFRSVAKEGSTTATKTATGPAPPSGRTLVGQYYDIKTTADYSGKIKIRIIYDDTNMTLEKESSLQLEQWNATAARVVGDITGPNGWPDGKVDIRDLAKVAKLYGVIYPDPRYDPDCDLTGPIPGVPDGKIDIRDLAYVAKNYGKIIQEWISITVCIDTESNLIYGETNHLSIFGIT